MLFIFEHEVHCTLKFNETATCGISLAGLHTVALARFKGEPIV